VLGGSHNFAVDREAAHKAIAVKPDASSATAEGIETARQAQHLAAIGCDTGQGWHFGRPAPPARIAQLLSDRHAGPGAW
jgi:predicted signal transduction protein with EAL and GGDEF domain